METPLKHTPIGAADDSRNVFSPVSLMCSLSQVNSEVQNSEVKFGLLNGHLCWQVLLTAGTPPFLNLFLKHLYETSQNMAFHLKNLSAKLQLSNYYSKLYFLYAFRYLHEADY